MDTHTTTAYYGTTNSTTDYGDYNYGTEDDSDATPCLLGDTWSFTRLYAPVVYNLVFIFALLGNILVLAVVRRYRQSSYNTCSFSLTDTFLLHLAISDLLLALTLPFFAIQWIHEWVFGVGLCKIAGALFSLNIYCGVLFLACISVDRYLAIVHAVHTSWRRNTCLAQLACAVIWGGCLGLAAIDIHFRNVVLLPGKSRSVCSIEFSKESAENWEFSMQLISLLLGFGFPLIVMLFCYFGIFRALCKASTRRQKRRSIKLIASLVVVFVICWAPFNALKIVDSLVRLGWIGSSCSLHRTLDIGILVTESLGLSHCALNPLLYGFVGVKFRRELVAMFKTLLRPGGCFGMGGWVQRQGSSRRTTGSFSSVESDNTSYYSVVV